MLRKIILLLLMTSCSFATDSPKRIGRQLAERNLIKKVDPIIPPLAKTLEIGGTVSLEITISREGKVGSVKVLSGHPMLVPAFVDVVKKWGYSPFVQGGQPISVVTTVEWNVSSPTRSNTEETALQGLLPDISNLLPNDPRREEL